MPHTLLAIALIAAAPSRGVSAEATRAQQDSLAAHKAFLLEHFTNFSRVTFLPPTNGTQTVIQYFKVNERVIGTFQGLTHAGVQFTLPEWCDGNLRWIFFHMDPDSRNREGAEAAWGLFPERGNRVPAVLKRLDPDGSVSFWKNYPNTARVYANTVARTNLQPGARYGLYFVHYDRTPPYIGFALTIDSERGRREFGSLDFIRGREGASRAFAVSPVTAFIQQNWTNFPSLSFQAPTNQVEAAFQRVLVDDHLFCEADDRFYSGVRFTVPSWLDGDIAFALVHLYASKNDLRRRPGYSWGVTAERGEMPALLKLDRIPFADFPAAQAKFPNSEKAYATTVQRRFLLPGATYVFWQAHWGQTDGVVPDVAFTITVDSARGRKEFGEIVWR